MWMGVCNFLEWNDEYVNNEIKYELITHEHMNFNKFSFFE